MIAGGAVKDFRGHAETGADHSLAPKRQ